MSTVLGATIGALTNYILAVRRERSERDRDSRVHAVEIKRAARLIDLELLKAQALAGIAINKRYWVLEPDAQISSDVWRQYAVTTSAELSYQAWVLVARAFVAAEHINGSRALQLSGVLRDRPLSDDDAQGISVMQSDVSRGREALIPLMM